MSVAAQAMALAQSGREADAKRLVEGSNDPDALVLKGLWRVEGRLFPRDLAAARVDFAAASAAGHVLASRFLAALLAAGRGGPQDWKGACSNLEAAASGHELDARQVSAIASMQIDAGGNPTQFSTEIEPVSDEPSIRIVRGAMTPDECRLLIDLGQQRFRPAVIFHDGQQKFVLDPIRQSDAAGFPIIYETPFVHAINRRLAALTGTHVDQGEPIQVLRYSGPQQYRPHLDAPRGLPNQRILTALVWLNDDFDGGETHFTKLGLHLKGRQGDAVIFSNITADGLPDPLTEHAGLPVSSGTKFIATRWIRAEAPDESGFGQHEMYGKS